MNLLPPHFNWNHARAFLAIARHGSLTAAAKVLRESQPTLGRQLAKLEEDLGLVLFERLGRRLKLTQAGERLQDHFLAMAEAADDVFVTATQQSQSGEGQVVVTATNFIATHALPQAIRALAETAPNLRIHIDTSNEVQDLKHRAADIAVRHARPTGADLIGKLVGHTQARLFVSPAYIDRFGRPQTPADLTHSSFIGFEDVAAYLPMLQNLGLPLTERNFYYTTNSGSVIGALIQQGLGLSLLTLDMAAQYPEFEEVLPDQEPIPIPIWLVCHRELKTARKIRLVFDAVEKALLDFARPERGRTL